MITVRYEEYTNDYIRRNTTKTFSSLGEFENWFFSLCNGSYEQDISIPDPRRSDIPSGMEVRCYQTEGKCYWVHMISRDAGIIYSDGHHTDGQRHWNDETKSLCVEMIQRKKKPTFNFV